MQQDRIHYDVPKKDKYSADDRFNNIPAGSSGQVADDGCFDVNFALHVISPLEETVWSVSYFPRISLCGMAARDRFGLN